MLDHNFAPLDGTELVYIVLEFQSFYWRLLLCVFAISRLIVDTFRATPPWKDASNDTQIPWQVYSEDCCFVRLGEHALIEFVLFFVHENGVGIFRE